MNHSLIYIYEFIFISLQRATIKHLLNFYGVKIFLFISNLRYLNMNINPDDLRLLENI